MNSSDSTNQQDQPRDRMGSRRLLVITVQVIGFGMGIVLLGWAVRMALRAENREQLAKLSEATPGELMLLLTLAAVSVGLNGIIFWVVINPVHRLRPTDVIATNAIATFMAYLPFKLSVVTRFVIHNRRDRIPVITIGAWILSEAILMGVVLAPLALASFWLKEINTLWWAVSIPGVFSGVIIGTVIARQLGGARGRALFGRLGLSEQTLESTAFTRVCSGFEMLGNQRATLCVAVCRLLDIAGFALRFYVASRVLGMPLSVQDAMLLGATYFLIGASSPTGMLGTREAGTIGMAGLVGISSTALTETTTGQIPIAATVLFVTAVEAVVNLGCAGFGIAWLKARKPLDPAGESAETELISRSIDHETDSE